MELPDLIMQEPYRPWDWSALSQNPGVTMDFMDDTLYLPWEWGSMSANTSLTDDDVMNIPEFAIQWDMLSANTMLGRYPSLLTTFRELLNWEEVSGNSSISLHCVQENPDLPWNHRGLSRNPHLTLGQIRRMGIWCDWDWKEISKNPGINVEDVLENPTLPWDWRALSENSSITMADVKFYPTIPWDGRGLSSNPNLSWRVIEHSPTLPWNWVNIYENPGVNVPIIPGVDPGFELYWSRVAKNPRLRWCDIDRAPRVPWERWIAGRGDLVSISIVMEDIGKQWDWGAFSENCTLTSGIVSQCIGSIPWDWARLSRNSHL